MSYSRCGMRFHVLKYPFVLCTNVQKDLVYVYVFFFFLQKGIFCMNMYKLKMFAYTLYTHTKDDKKA